MKTRRDCLRALGLGAAAAPWLPLLPSHAGEEPSPRRLLFVHFAHGVAYDQWQQPSTGESLALGPTLEPLAPWLDRTTVVEGLTNPIVLDQIGDVHNVGLGTLLTSAPLSIDQGAGGHYLPGGPSIDRVIGEGLVATAELPPPHATLAFGVRSQGFALSAADLDVPLRAEDDPRAQYERIFGELALPPEQRAERRQTRAELRAFVRRRLDALESNLPSEDREALQRHRAAVESLEARALVEHPVPSACVPPALPPDIDAPAAPANEDIPALVDATSELVTAALACDQTRVATIQWGSSGNDGLAHTWQGISTDYHSTAHLAGATREGSWGLMKRVSKRLTPSQTRSWPDFEIRTLQTAQQGRWSLDMCRAGRPQTFCRSLRRQPTLVTTSSSSWQAFTMLCDGKHKTAQYGRWSTNEISGGLEQPLVIFGLTEILSAHTSAAEASVGYSS